MSLLDRVLASVDLGGEHWLWIRHLDPEGYGRIRVDDRRVMAHRAVYELLVEPIPPGLTIDHLCRVRSCVHPDHLEPVTIGENLRRGDTMAARNAAKTACDHGHDFTPENTRINSQGRRVCITCANATRARYLERKAASRC